MSTLPVDSLPFIAAKIFDPVGRCIYCGTVIDLTREHIVPYGIGGTFVLPASSCKTCATITSEFERKVLRGPMWPVRAHLQLQSRRANLAPKHGRLVIVRNGTTEEIYLPLAEHPLMLMFPRFAEPSIFTGKHVRGIAMRGHATYSFGKRPDDVQRALGASKLEIPDQQYAIVPFAQLLGKIAWSMAVADDVLGRIEKRGPSLVDALIKFPDDIGRWVGTFPEAPAPLPREVLHSIALMEIAGYLVYHIQLFASSQTPRYAVVVGKTASAVVGSVR